MQKIIDESKLITMNELMAKARLGSVSFFIFLSFVYIIAIVHDSKIVCDVVMAIVSLNDLKKEYPEMSGHKMLNRR